MHQTYHALTTFVTSVQRGMYMRRWLQNGLLAGTMLLALLLLGIAIQNLIPLVPFAALLYSCLAILILLAVARSHAGGY